MSKTSKLPNIRRLSKIDYLTLFENAIVEKFGFEYNDDNANISWEDLDDIRAGIIKNPYLYYYSKEGYEYILSGLSGYVFTQLSNHDLDGFEIREEDLVAILEIYNDGYDLEDSVYKQLEKIRDLLNEEIKDLE